MADDSCDPKPAPSEPIKPGTRMVMCAKNRQGIARIGSRALER